jgi:dTDP-4-amino-4,6-dideoxygalactose transaminase
MIGMNQFSAEPDELVQQEIAAVERVIRSGWYILGSEVSQFEAEWAACCDVSEAVGVGNGMDAIEIGLRALGIGPGDEVITTPMTAFATVLAVLRCGASPVLADIDPATALLDIESAERCLSSRTRAVLHVHLYGQMPEVKPWIDFCNKAGIYFLEDCAQAHLARSKGVSAGAAGAWGAFSFYPTKNLGTFGDGGALVTNSDDVAKQARILRNYGQSERYHHPVAGLNSRLDELHAAILRTRLLWLRKFTDRRRQIANRYISEIRNSRVRLLRGPADAESHVFHLFVLLCDERERLHRYLRDCKIDSLSHYPVPIHLQPPCKALTRDPEGLERAEHYAARCLSIPCHPQMVDVDVDHVVEAINAFK